jgi:cell division protein YceG involved in septum cleavage
MVSIDTSNISVACAILKYEVCLNSSTFILDSFLLLFTSIFFLLNCHLDRDCDKKEKVNYIKLNDVKLSDVIIMASILEGEANGEKDINIISNILWKRISLDMPLQVDVDRFTYINKGLPTSPLNNPGLASIKAAMNKDKTPYLYYLHEKNGNVHYATSFEEHKKNISKYLK